ncbi:hypothetical protein PS420_08310 [Pediococcus acidilactici]
MKPTQNNLLGYLLKNLQNSELVERLLRNLQGQQLAYRPIPIENDKKRRQNRTYVIILM